MWWGGHDGMGWWMAFGGLWILVFWGTIIWLIVWGIGKLTGSGGREDDPLEIARRRYARGEITREQFDEIWGTLGANR